MTLQNLHTHTVFSDGKNTPEEMVLGAVRAGCTSLGFSEHSPLAPFYDPDRYAMEAADLPAYRSEIWDWSRTTTPRPRARTLITSSARFTAWWRTGCA